MNRVNETLDRLWYGHYGARQVLIGGLLMVPMLVATAAAPPSVETFHVWTVGEWMGFIALSTTFGLGSGLVARTILSSQWSKPKQSAALALVGLSLLIISRLAG